MTVFLESLAILLIVLGNAFFVAAEYALVTARRSRLVQMAHGGSLRARIALRIMDSPVRFIGTVQLGITAFSILLGIVGEPLVRHWFDGILSSVLSFVFAYGIVTYLHVTLGELVPKAIALDRREETALWVALPIEAVYVFAYPIVWFLQASANAFTRLFGIHPAPAGVVAHSEEDIRLIVSEAERSGAIEEEEQQMISKVFDFGDKEAADVMVPRVDVVALSIDLPPEEALKAVMDSPYTRYPVYRESLDEILGILHVRDLFAALMDVGIEQVELEDLLRTPYFVPETKDLASLLAEFRAQNLHMAIVLDEYGAMEGIVTLEDLLEEIVGEIEDEFDLPHDALERLDDHTVRISGVFPIDEFNEQLGTALPEEDYHTVAGFVFGLIGRAPEAGDEVEHEGIHIRVNEVEGTRIQMLTVTLPSEDREAVGADERAAER